VHDCAWGRIVDGFVASMKVLEVHLVEVEVRERESERTRHTLPAVCPMVTKRTVMAAGSMRKKRHAGASSEAAPTRIACSYKFIIRNFCSHTRLEAYVQRSPLCL
jgi:hypothetical protein